jgi:hypothetical protein
LLFQAYAYPRLRADGLSCRHGQRFASGTSAMISTATMPWRNCLDHARMRAPFFPRSLAQDAVSNR